ncbi:MAG: VOC family protein [Bacteroidales bacterium]
MKIEHLALWTRDLENMKRFYEKYFGMTAGERYYNPQKHFSSYFLTFSHGARLELMHRSDIRSGKDDPARTYGFTHFAISVGSRDKVDHLTRILREAGYDIPGEPRVTGDGYYESVICDPEGNRVEITE